MNKDTIFKKVHGFENVTAFVILVLLALFPTLEILVRNTLKTGIPGSSSYMQHLVIWVTFIGGMITSRENQHLALRIGLEAIREDIRRHIIIAISLIGFSICLSFGISAISFVILAFDSSVSIGFLPLRLVNMIMPVGFVVMGFRFISGIHEKLSLKTVLSVLGIIIAILFSISSIDNLITSINPGMSLTDSPMYSVVNSGTVYIALPVIIILIGLGLLGMPIFVVLGGIAYFLFIRSGGSLSVIPNESYTLLIGNAIPAIPLFTFAGFILSESRSGERLVNLFKSLFGWLPGGMAFMAVLVCAFFTTFTGASGVTILALGGLLSYVLINSGKYSENFTTGLLTASGSIGLLFPPSLPIILYGVVAQINIKEMFVGGLFPGLVMVLILGLYSVTISFRKKIELTTFDLKEALWSIRTAIWEILLPFIIVAGFFGGLFSIVETGAVAVVYSLIIVLVIHRDIRVRDMPTVMLKSVPIIGGVLVILALARGLSYYIVDAEIPVALSTWVEMHIQSKILFLVILNLALLLTGCIMDIFSALVVVVPLILPLGELFGIHPVHLGIIFLANLELGYLTPPVGLNLFLASYRFEKPLTRIYGNVIPFFLVLLVTVILITYIPWISTGLLDVITF